MMNYVLLIGGIFLALGGIGGLAEGSYAPGGAMFLLGLVMFGYSQRGKKQDVPRFSQTLQTLQLPEAQQEEVTALFNKAQEDYTAINQNLKKLRRTPYAADFVQLQNTAGHLLDYLSRHPAKVTIARRFITYYQDRAKLLSGEFCELETTGLATENVQETKKRMQEAVLALQQPYEAEFEKILSDKLLDMDAEITVMEQTMTADGYEKQADVTPNAGASGTSAPLPGGRKKGPMLSSGIGRKNGNFHRIRQHREIMERPISDLAFAPDSLLREVRMQRTVSSLLALFFGGFGLHKFYQGRKKTGILYLCFFWTGIPALVGFFEGIRYIFMSNDTYYRDYFRE